MGRVATRVDAVLADSSLVIAYFRARPTTESALERAAASFDEVFVSAITVYEVEFGAAKAGRVSDLESISITLPVLPIDRATADRAARLHDQLIGRNQDIGLRDVLIAATAMEHSLALATLNAAHFQRVSGLQVIDAATL